MLDGPLMVPTLAVEHAEQVQSLRVLRLPRQQRLVGLCGDLESAGLVGMNSLLERDGGDPPIAHGNDRALRAPLDEASILLYSKPWLLLAGDEKPSLRRDSVGRPPATGKKFPCFSRPGRYAIVSLTRKRGSEAGRKAGGYKKGRILPCLLPFRPTSVL